MHLENTIQRYKSMATYLLETTLAQQGWDGFGEYEDGINIWGKKVNGNYTELLVGPLEVEGVVNNLHLIQFSFDEEGNPVKADAPTPKTEQELKQLGCLN